MRCRKDATSSKMFTSRRPAGRHYRIDAGGLLQTKFLSATRDLRRVLTDSDQNVPLQPAISGDSDQVSAGNVKARTLAVEEGRDVLEGVDVAQTR